MSLVGLLLVLVIACLVIWAARRLLAAFGLGEPITTVVYVVLVIAIVLWVLSTLGLGVPGLRVR